MDTDLTDLAPPAVYALLTQVVVPRPVAWVLTGNADASLNLAPFSYFTAVASEPPTIVLSIGRKPDGSIKDTRANLEARGACVVHIAHTELAASVTATAATLPAGESEVSALGLQTVPMVGSPLPRLAGCRVALAGEFVSLHEIGKQGVAFVRVDHVHVADEAVGEDAKGRAKVLSDVLEPIARLGGGDYLVGGRVISIARPD